MKILLLLSALSMAMSLVFAPMAVAQDDLNCGDLSEAEEQAVFAADPSDPNGLDENDNGVPCEDDTTDNGSFALPAEEATMMEESTMMLAEETMMTDDASPEATMTMNSASPESDDEESATPTATAESDDEESATANASASASPLPDTGGVVSPALLSVAAAVLLVGGGIASVSIVRRR